MSQEIQRTVVCDLCGAEVKQEVEEYGDVDLPMGWIRIVLHERVPKRALGPRTGLVEWELRIDGDYCSKGHAAMAIARKIGRPPDE